MKKIFTLGFGIFMISLIYSQTSDKHNLKYKPQTLDEAITQLDLIFHDTVKAQILTMTEDEFLSNTHMSTGMWIRNNWGLWRGKQLAKYFNDLGIYHPDDMSGIILRSYYRHLSNKPYDLDKQIEYYKEYWKKANEHQYKMRTDTAYVRQIEIENEKARIEYYDKIKEPYPPGTKVTAWVDYSIGMFNKGRTQIEGKIVEWKDTDAIIEITKFLDDTKESKVKRYNKMKDNKLSVNIYQIDIW